MKVMSRFLLCLCLSLTSVFSSLPQIGHAQDAPIAATKAIDYAEWNSVAGRVENAISAGLASTAVFESLRTEIVGWREIFLQGQSVNAARITTLQGQIQALGPKPAEGEVEAPELADRRSALETQLAEARAPVRAAEEAFSRAEGLTREIDSIIRIRQTDDLLKLAPTPINPALWPAALNDLLISARAIGTETMQNWNSDVRRAAFRSALPKTLLFMVIALALVLRGRAVMERVTGRVLDRLMGRTRGVIAFITSLGQIIFPVGGILLLVEALLSTGMLGLRGQMLAHQLPWIGLYIFGARWLGLRLFPKRTDLDLPFQMTRQQAMTMRRSATTLGILMGARMVLSTLAEYEGYSDATTGVILMPIKVLIGLFLLNISRVLVAAAHRFQGDDETANSARGLMFVGRAVSVLAVFGVAMGAIGYLNAGNFMLAPTVYTLGLFGLLLLINNLILDLYAFATGSTQEETQEALIPTLINFTFVLCTLPIFALIWGARFADLTELWAQFREGFTLGETRISPQSFLTFVAVFSAFYIATRLLQGTLRNKVLPKTKIDSGGQTAMVSGIGYIGIFLAALIAINSAGINLSSLAIVAGALSVGIGFGLQNIVSNFVSGIILLIERPVAQGDWIEVGGHMGIVKDISVRSTRIETFDKNDVIVPNADFISGSVKNWTRNNLIGRIILEVGVAYGTDTRRVQAILEEIVSAHPLVTITPAPGVDFMGFGADALDFRIRAVLRDVNFSVAVRTELNHQIAERFVAEGIEIPFAQRDIWLRNPEALVPQGASKAPEKDKGPAALEKSKPQEAGLPDDSEEDDPERKVDRPTNLVAEDFED
jgi:small-conductance mechanosensitive channel